ncbi:hypothetical protein JTE90_004319 [Oedothorax gibbosus]|uniref:Uncharacterized protein n=1 Tax=Oedothorax gibbosus TaxID=931172 RepID=A0AAV6VKQ6_9ARAC|nr:hypothetical protein JTE90_004319 [Oedothorax gibbosus]
MLEFFILVSVRGPTSISRTLSLSDMHQRSTTIKNFYNAVYVEYFQCCLLSLVFSILGITIGLFSVIGMSRGFFVWASVRLAPFNRYFSKLRTYDIELKASPTLPALQ